MPTGTVRDPCQPSVAGPTPITTFTRSFAGRPESACAARRWVAGLLANSPSTDVTVLMLSELFTNAILHSASGLPGGVVTVRLTISADAVRVDVVDQGEIPPGGGAGHGLGAGLVIVSRLADVFGADGPDRWFMVQLPCSSTAAQALEQAERDAAREGG